MLSTNSQPDRAGVIRCTAGRSKNTIIYIVVTHTFDFRSVLCVLLRPSLRHTGQSSPGQARQVDQSHAACSSTRKDTGHYYLPTVVSRLHLPL